MLLVLARCTPCGLLCVPDGGGAAPRRGGGAEEHQLHAGSLRQLHRAAGEAPSERLQVRSAAQTTQQIAEGTILLGVDRYGFFWADTNTDY